MAGDEIDYDPEFLAGRIHALLAFALALIETHPNLALLEQHLAAAEQAGLAVTEATLVPDKFLDGQRQVMERLRQRAVRAQARRDRRNIPDKDRGPQQT